MILGKWLTWRTIFMYLFIFLTIYMFRTHRAHHQERQIVSIQPAHDTVTDTDWHVPDVVLTQFVSPDDEHGVLETCRVKNINKYIKNCASRWSFTKLHRLLVVIGVSALGLDTETEILSTWNSYFIRGAFWFPIYRFYWDTDPWYIIGIFDTRYCH
jgi:uncharacterized membrane protein SirB2